MYEKSKMDESTESIDTTRSYTETKSQDSESVKSNISISICGREQSRINIFRLIRRDGEGTERNYYST